MSDKSKKRSRNCFTSVAGFTLVEAMVAGTVIVVSLVSGFGALIQGNRLIEMSRDETRASQILQSEIEELRTYDWATLIALPTDSTYAPESSFTDSYSTRYTVQRKILTRGSLQKRIVIDLSWTDNGGKDHNREYITVITKGGVYDFYYRTI